MAVLTLLCTSRDECFLLIVHLSLYKAATHSDLTPDAVQASEALVTFDASVTAVALGRRVTLHPYMLHSLEKQQENGTFFIQVFNAFQFCIQWCMLLVQIHSYFISQILLNTF